MARIHTAPPMYTHTQPHYIIYTRTFTRSREPLCDTYMHKLTRAYTHTRTHAHTHTNADQHIHTFTNARAHTHTHTVRAVCTLYTLRNPTVLCLLKLDLLKYTIYLVCDKI